MNANKVGTIRLLVVSREPAVLRLLWSIEESNSWHLETAASGWDAMEQVQSGTIPHLLLLDLPRGDAEGLHLLRWLRRLQPGIKVLILCHPEDGACGKEAIRMGAEEILVRPFDERQLESAIRRHLNCAEQEPAKAKAERLARRNDGSEIVHENVESLGEGTFVSASLIMQKLRAQAALLAQTDVPVLILGEHGAGKYTVATLIHKLSVRSGFKLVRVNCAEMPETLLEAELFGSDRSTAAASRRVNLGKLAAGEKGTIVLDEIAAMPLPLQSRLLQILESNESRQTDSTPPDVRILAASSADLDRALAEKRLREDLYYRLSAFTVYVPPLRQRRNEIAILLRYFMHKLARHYNLLSRAFSPAALEACQQYSWPGNLTEMETFVKRYLVAGDLELALGEMGLEANSAAGKVTIPLAVTFATDARTADAREDRQPGAKQAKPESLKSLIQGIKSEAEQSAITAALKRTGWNRKAAARLLRVSYRTLLYKIEQYGMRAPEPMFSQLPVEEFSVYGDEAKGNGKAN